MAIQKRSFARVASTVVALGFIAWGVTEARRDRPTLSASVNHGRPDMDGDGLADTLEAVMGTRIDRADTDLDGYSDLEEQARGSDPLSRDDYPAAQPMRVGTSAAAEEGYVAYTSAVYVAGSDLDDVDINVGFVHRGRVVELPPSLFSLSRGTILPARDSRDTLVVIEIAFPECVVQRYGQVNLFTVVRNYSTATPTASVAVLPLVDFSGTTVSVEPTRQNFTSANGTPSGVVYRPIVSDSQIPSTWSGGQICWQRTAAVGTDGAMILHEVEAADCKPMDTYCSSTDCGAGVGKTLRLPNPAAIAGG